MIRRVQLSRRAGAKLPGGTKVCGRPGALSNPFTSGNSNTPVDCVKQFRVWAEAAIELPFGYLSETQKRFREAFLKSEADDDQIYACWCALSSWCHVDIIIELRNRRLWRPKLDELQISNCETLTDRESVFWKFVGEKPEYRKFLRYCDIGGVRTLTIETEGLIAFMEWAIPKGICKEEKAAEFREYLRTLTGK